MSRVGGDYTTRSEDQAYDRKRESQAEAGKRRTQTKFEQTRNSDNVETQTTTGPGSTGGVAQANERFAGLGYFAEGLMADTTAKAGVEAGDAAAGNLQANLGEMAKAFAPLAELVVESPPEGVTPAASFTVDNALPLHELHLNPTAEKRGAEFNAVFSGAEKNIVLRAFAKVYDKQLSNLQHPAGPKGARVQLTPEQEQVRQQFVAVTGQVFRQSGITMDDLANAAPGGDAKVEGEQPPAEGATTAGEGPGKTAQQPALEGPAMAKANQSNNMPQDGKVYAIPQLLARPSSGGGLSASQLGRQLQSTAGMDIDALVQLVMLEVADDQEKELRTVADHMQKMNEAKKSQRALQQAYRQAQSKLEGDMRGEFEKLKHDGVLGDGVTFDDYKSWRKVIVGAPRRDADGVVMTDAVGRPIMSEPCLPEPSPPLNLPPFLTEDKPEVDGASADGISSAASDLAKGFGITDDQIQFLRDYYYEYFTDEYGSKSEDGFKQFLENNVKLSDANSMEDVEANNAAIRTFLDDLKADPSGGQDLDATSEANMEAIEEVLQDIKSAAEEMDAIYAAACADPEAYGFPAGHHFSSPQELWNSPAGFPFFKDYKDRMNGYMKDLRDFKRSYLNEEDAGQLGQDITHALSAVIYGAGNEHGVIEKFKNWIGGTDGLNPNSVANELLNRAGQPTDEFGQPIHILDGITIAHWVETQTEAENELRGATLYEFGLSTEDMGVVQELWWSLSAAERAQYGDDLHSFMADGLGLKDPTAADYDPAKNRQQIQSFVDARIASASGEQLIQLQNLSATLKLASEGGLNGDQFGLSANYADALQAIWLQLPEATRAQFSGSFKAFAEAIGLKQGNDGPANQALIDAFIAGLSDADKAAAAKGMAKLELAQKPIDVDGFGLKNDEGTFLEYMWQQMSPADRATYGGDINEWLEQALHLEASADAGPDNEAKIEAWVVANYGPLPDKEGKSFPIYGEDADQTMSEAGARANGYVFVTIDGEAEWVPGDVAEEQGWKDGDVLEHGSGDIGSTMLYVQEGESAYEQVDNPPKKPGEVTDGNYADDGGPATGNMGGSDPVAQQQGPVMQQTSIAIQLLQGGAGDAPGSYASGGPPEPDDPAAMWAKAKAGDIEGSGVEQGAPRNDYIDQLIDSGILEEASATTANHSSNNDAATGDNLITGEKAQNLPPGEDGAMMSLSSLDNLEQQAKDDLDSMSEQSELEMLRMQILMDRRSRAFETLSNILKKAGTAADGIIANVK